jgi:hypothetical protein
MSETSGTGIVFSAIKSLPMETQPRRRQAGGPVFRRRTRHRSPWTPRCLVNSLTALRMAPVKTSTLSDPNLSFASDELRLWPDQYRFSSDLGGTCTLASSVGIFSGSCTAARTYVNRLVGPCERR